jgi:hypothetical protein
MSTKPTKTVTKRAIKALPALRISLLWFKRETIRHITRRAQDASSPRLRIALWQKVRQVRETDLADLRNAYQCERVREISQTPRFELSQAIPGIVWLHAS